MSEIAIELWNPIDGYEGWYEVSDMGRVRSLDRDVHFRDGKNRHYTGKILKFRYHNGYAMVNLNRNKAMKEFYVHRLVIENFTLQPVAKPWVNHKNGKKWDDRLENLEWCTPSENNIHAVKHGLRVDNVEGLLESNRARRKSVTMYIGEQAAHTEVSALDMARYLIHKKFVPISDESKVRYAIRYACQSGRVYYGMEFAYAA